MSDLSNRLGNLSRKERAALLELLRQRKEGAAAPVRLPEPEPPAADPVAPPAGLPLSFAQQRLWFLDQLAPGSPLYNVTGMVRIEGPLGPLDVPVLAACFGEVVRRHAALRTRYEMGSAGPVQVIEPPSASPFPLPVNDLSALSATLRSTEERRLAREEIRTPFDLGRPPMLRLRLLRLGPDDHRLVLVLHHIAGDAWSIDVLIREMALLYPALRAGRPSPLPELSTRYADFAVAQRGQLQGETLAREIGFWRDRLAGAPALELPTDRPRRAVPTFRGGAFTISVPAPLEDLLRRFAREERATLFMALLAPFSALLSHHADTGDVTVGTTVTGRNVRDHLGLIGFFVNTLALRIDLSADPDGRGLLDAARQAALESFAHQALPFEKLVDELGLPRDPYRPPLLRVIFQLYPPAPPAGDGVSSLRLSKVEIPGETSKADLVVNVSENPEGLIAQWRYDADLFDTSTIVRWSGSFLTLLAGWLEDPARRLAELPLLSASQRHQLLTEWNQRAAFPAMMEGGRRSLPGLFEEQVDRTPDAPAVSMGSERMTYRELDQRAEGLARWLLAAGVLPGDRVALLLDRSPAMVAAILGVLKTGAAYVPLDPALPAERLGFLLADSGARLVLTTEGLAGSLPDALPATARPILLDREPGVSERRSGERLRLPLDPELPAYVIYTSGSTGQPKGVAVPHGNVSHLVAATSPLFGFGPDDVWTLFHSYAFDVSVFEIWGALLHGARLVVVPYWESRSPEVFYRLLRTERVTVLSQTPSAFRQLLWAEEAVLSAGNPDLPELALREVIFAGEALEPAMLAPWFARRSDLQGDRKPRLVNMYGITETTVHVTFRPITREDVGRPGSRLGRPFPGPAVYIVDDALRPRPIGIPGELCVGGVGPAPGYLGRPELTAERFVPDPFGPPGSRLYRSGDLARWLPDGDLESLGRIDHQVKIRGFRIEPGEVEAALIAHPGIREAVVLARQEGAGASAASARTADRRLVAWVTAGPEGAPPFPELREYLAGRLPEHMIPSALVVLDQLPLTVNGKVDRRALPAPDAAPASAAEREHVPPRDALERFLAGLWSGVLALPGQREVGIHDNFFALGGDSISGAVLINRLQATLGEIVHVVTIFDHPRLEALAGYVRAQHPAAAARIWGVQAAEGGAEADASRPPVGDAQIAEMRRLIVETRPEADLPADFAERGAAPPNPPAVFLLSPPRSGSTLLRVMLGAHPRLFAPPELELLSFRTLAGRRAAFQGRDSFWLEGVTRAVMEARSCGPEEAARLVEEGERDGWTTRRFYRELQGWIADQTPGGRMLVDKTPSYALDPEVLRRAEGWFSGARYLHLLRHPRAARRSFEEARLDQIFFRRPHSFSRGQLAELIWTVSHRNLLDFLAEVPAERKWTVRFEELVRDPERVLAGICGFLGLEYDPAMADPYRADAGRRSSRMVDGPHAESRMLGDVKLLAHGKVDEAVGERWREAGGPPLGEPTRELAAALGYRIESSWEEGGSAPVSFAQERLWLLDQIAPGTAAYNIEGGFRLRGDLDRRALGHAIAEIVRRHDALRTTFAVESGRPGQRPVQRPVQRIAPFDPESPLALLPWVDLSALPEEPREAESRRLVRDEGERPFDLAAGPLFRSVLLRLAPREHIALYTMHHIVSDGWSMGVFFREVGILYEAFAAGRPSPLPELPLQYPDFARRQRERLSGEALAVGLAEWRRILEGVPPLELPADRPRPATRSWRGDAVPFTLGPSLLAELAALVRAERSTLYVLLLALFQTFLRRFSGQEDVAVGTAVANRTDSDAEALIGFFVNTVVMRTDLSGDPPFREVIRRARQAALEAFHLQEIPFEKVIEAAQPERHTSRSPLFQVMMTVQNTPERELPAGGLILEPLDTARGTAKFDLTLTSMETPAGLAGLLEFDLDLFDPATVWRMARHLVTLIEGALADPERRISELPLLTVLEREQTVLSWNRTAAAIPRGLPLHRLIEEQVDRAPDAVAVSSGEDLTYAALDAAANRLARRLRRLGAGREVPVLVLAERSPELIVALLAVMKSGGFFVPLDPAHPRERLAALAARSGARLAVTWERSLDLLPAGITSVCLDRDRGEIEAERAARLVDTATDGNLLYVMFTSGSTGEPKGVAVTHRNVIRLVRGTDFATMGPGETFLMVAPASFDASTLEIWGPLANGGRIAVFPPHVPALNELADFLGRQGVTQLFLTSGLFHQMAEERPGGFAGLRRLMTGGEVLAPDLLRKVLAAHSGLVLVAAYGPTEGTTFTTCHPLTAPDQLPAGGPVPLGRPIANTTVHVLEGRLEGSLEPAPLGVWGELCIGGEGVARGYFGRSDLTAERFVPDPFSALTGAPGERLYRTGDLARRRPDGVLEFLGRIDRQVKIRGFRIEPAEVEAALAAHPEVADVAVLVRGEGVDKRLVAYVATGSSETAAPSLGDKLGDELGDELRRWLAGRLPEPMVPAAVVVLPRLPLTANGKVDRRELARIAPERKTAELVAPRTPVERTLAGLFVEVLGPERTGGRVGVHDSFFELGGHSLLATRLVAAVRDTFRIELPLRLVFERPTLEGLAAAVTEAGATGITGLEADQSARLTRLERTPGAVHRFPVSFSQLREWILDRLEPGNPAYNIPSNLRIGGPLSVPVLEAALRELLRRHESLRTAFAAAEEEPVQVVAPEVPFHVPVIDLSALPESLREAELSRRVRAEARTGFDLSVAPLLRARVVRLGREDHALLTTVHHIVSDGWSIGIFNRELAALYQATTAGHPSPLPELPVQYGDYAAWQRARLGGTGLDEQLAWWRQRLAGAPPLLELPTDRPRPPVRSSRGGRVRILLPERLSTALRALRRGTTPFMVVLAGFQALLACWSGQEDVLVGTYSGNRPRRELEGLIGFFINTLVLRTDLGGGPSFGALLDRVRETTLGAYTHADVPFEKLLETLHLPRDPSRTPLFQVLLVLQNFPPARADLTTGVRLTGMANPGDNSDYDLALALSEGADGIGGTFDYSTDLFEEATIVRLADQLRTLLEAAVTDPDRDVWTLPLIGAEERRRLLQVESRGPDLPSGEPLLHRLVEAQAARTPDTVAVEAGSVRLTYAELLGRARRLSHRLREAGAGPESIVGLSAERSPDLIVGMLAILQAGAAYLPLDPAYPPDRLDLMLEDSGATILVAPPSSPLGGGIGGETPSGGDGVKPGVSTPGQGRIVRISPDGAMAGSLPGVETPGFTPPSPLGPESPAYVIYTSGSTGRPKGVVVPHRAISSFTRAARDTYGVGPGDRVLQFASISFDTSAEEIWPALATGATLVLRPDDMAASIPHFLREAERLGITLLDLPTAFWHELAAGMDADLEAGSLDLPRGLRLVIIGGEEALADRLAAWRRRVPPSVRLVNTYGPTESTIVATRRELAGFAEGTPAQIVPIGRPIPGARVYLLDRFFEPVPPGVRGELWIGGSGVARGYLKRPDLTAERFIPDPFGGEPGGRLYRTGDLGVLRPDGDLVFAGRADRQLKVRGYRIEPGEIEAALRLHPDLRDAVVDARGPGDVRRLVAWVVPREGVPVEAVPGSADLKAFLRGRLPDPMLPAAFMAVAALPLTPSGKVDRRALPEPAESRTGTAGWAEPQTGLERTIAGIFRDLLRVDRVGLNDNFFDLGGHSLLVVRAHQKLKEALGKEIPVLDLFRFPTVASLARHLEGEETGTMKKVQNLAEQQRAAQLRQKQAMERLRRPGGPVRR